MAVPKKTMSTSNLNITKTCLYNFDPLKPHFYIVKLELTGVYIIFLIFARKQIVGTRSIYVLSRNMKNIRVFYLKFFHILEVKFSIYLNRRVFVMITFYFYFSSDSDQIGVKIHGVSSYFISDTFLDKLYFLLMAFVLLLFFLFHLQNAEFTEHALCVRKNFILA